MGNYLTGTTFVLYHRYGLYFSFTSSQIRDSKGQHHHRAGGAASASDLVGGLATSSPSADTVGVDTNTASTWYSEIGGDSNGAAAALPAAAAAATTATYFRFQQHQLQPQQTLLGKPQHPALALAGTQVRLFLPN